MWTLPVTKYLGVQFVFLLEEHGMASCNPVFLAMDPNFLFGRPTEIHLHFDALQTEFLRL